MSDREADILKRFQTIHEMASSRAILETIEAFAQEIGQTSIRGVPISVFFLKKKMDLIDKLIASLADADPNCAAELKRKFDELKRQSGG